MRFRKVQFDRKVTEQEERRRAAVRGEHEREVGDIYSIYNVYSIHSIYNIYTSYLFRCGWRGCDAQRGRGSACT